MEKELNEAWKGSFFKGEEERETSCWKIVWGAKDFLPFLDSLLLSDTFLPLLNYSSHPGLNFPSTGWLLLVQRLLFFTTMRPAFDSSSLNFGKMILQSVHLLWYSPLSLRFLSSVKNRHWMKEGMEERERDTWKIFQTRMSKHLLFFLFFGFPLSASILLIWLLFLLSPSGSTPCLSSLPCASKTHIFSVHRSVRKEK